MVLVVFVQVCQQQAGLSASLRQLRIDLISSNSSSALLGSLNNLQMTVSSYDRLQPLASAILHLSDILQAADQVYTVQGRVGSMRPSLADTFGPRAAVLKTLAGTVCAADANRASAAQVMCQCLVTALAVQAAAALPEAADAFQGAARMSSLGLVVALMQAFTHPAGLMCAMDSAVLPEASGTLHLQCNASYRCTCRLHLEWLSV